MIDTIYGPSAGIYSSNIEVARRVEVWQTNINNASANRADPVFYGGCKAPGWGREGPVQPSAT